MAILFGAVQSDYQQNKYVIVREFADKIANELELEKSRVKMTTPDGDNFSLFNLNFEEEKIC